MDNKLEIKLFRFNRLTDYLPYYKNFTLEYSNDETVLDLLVKLNNKETFEFEGVKKHGIKINDYFLTVDVPLKDLLLRVETNELTIEPVSIYRAIHDLTINNDDFLEKLNLFKEYLTIDQYDQYAESLQLDYYASNTLNFLKDYIGDHTIIIAHDIIEKNPEFEEEILNIISNKNNGAWFHTSVEKRLFHPDNTKQSKIQHLVSKITKTSFETEPTVERTVKVAQDFIGFNIAAYDQNDTCSLKDIVLQSKASFVETESKNDDVAFYTLEADKTFTYKIAGKILLDALDNNADFILVNNKKNFSLLDQKQKEIAQTVGRDINLPIVTVEQFNTLLNGEKDPIKLGFNKHKIAIPFL